MSDKQFQEAKANLAFSQSLRDQLRSAQAPVSPEMPPGQEIAEEVVEDAPEQETPDIEAPEAEEQAPGVVDMFKSFMEEMRGMFQNIMKQEKEEEKKEEILETPKE